MVRRQAIAQLAAARRKQHAKSLPLDIAGQEFANFRIVIDDEYALGGGGHLTVRGSLWISRPLLASP